MRRLRGPRGRRGSAVVCHAGLDGCRKARPHDRRSAGAVGGEAGTSAGNTALHPVQQAWIDEQVPQCGYCQSGMMIAAVDLLQKNPSPTVAQIKDAYTNTPPSPHLCRCGTYNAIISAVQRAAKAMNG